MRPAGEREVADGRPAQVEAVRVLPVALVAVGGGDEDADPGPGGQVHAAELGVLVDDAREHPDRRGPAQALLRRLGEVLRILAREGLLLAVGEQRVQRGGDDVARLVQPAGGEELDVRAHLLLGERAGVDERAQHGAVLGAVPVGGDRLVDEPVGALAALPRVGVVGVVAGAVDERLRRELQVLVARGMKAEQQLERSGGERAGEVAQHVHVPAVAHGASRSCASRVSMSPHRSANPRKRSGACAGARSRACSSPSVRSIVRPIARVMSDGSSRAVMPGSSSSPTTSSHRATT